MQYTCFKQDGKYKVMEHDGTKSFSERRLCALETLPEDAFDFWSKMEGKVFEEYEFEIDSENRNNEPTRYKGEPVTNMTPLSQNRVAIKVSGNTIELDSRSELQYPIYAIPKQQEQDLWDSISTELEMRIRLIEHDGFDTDNFIDYLKQHYTLTKKH